MAIFELDNIPATSTVHFSDHIFPLVSPQVMGILNLTPDSFYEDSRFLSQDLALARVEQMILEGASIIDIGAESSRPFAIAVSLQEEIDRIAQILSAIKERFNVLLSVDTYKPRVMQEAIRLGAHMVNDIYALRKPGAMEIVAASKVAVILVHMQNTPATMQVNPYYDNVVAEVADFLAGRAIACVEAGINKNRIVIDPGFGFGKTTRHNMQLLKNLPRLKKTGYPIAAGLSRKSSIGELLALPVKDRLFGSLSAHVIAALHGASIIRAHDIKSTVQALKIVEAVLSQEPLTW